MYGMNQGYASGESYSPTVNYLQPQRYAAQPSAYSQAVESNPAPYLDLEQHHAASIAEVFLEEQRPWTPIITQAHEVPPVIEQTFEKITGQEFPADAIRISIMDKDTLHGTHALFGSSTGEGLMGFSLNRYGKGLSEIFVKEDHLDSLLLTVGHEIGHILSPSLPSQKDEEAKAHAFSIAWMECIRDNNICGLTPNIRLNPARNGLHDVAYNFVTHLLKTGASAFDIFKTLSQGLTSMIARLETY